MRPLITRRPLYDDMMPRHPRSRRIMRRDMKRGDKKRDKDFELLAEFQCSVQEILEFEALDRQFDDECGPEAARQYQADLLLDGTASYDDRCLL